MFNTTMFLENCFIQVAIQYISVPPYRVASLHYSPPLKVLTSIEEASSWSNISPYEPCIPNTAKPFIEFVSCWRDRAHFSIFAAVVMHYDTIWISGECTVAYSLPANQAIGFLRDDAPCTLVVHVQLPYL